MGLTPFFHDDHLTVYQGDCREVMAAMEPESVHCVVTSPPYWGLRDYGTATWVGGDEGCDHKGPPKSSGGSTLKNDGRPADRVGQNDYERAAFTPFRDACRKCGAVRQDSQLGLEPTPEAFVANMVDVFREVRRVLRKDGTLWLNLGDSYAAGPSDWSRWKGGQTFKEEDRPSLKSRSGLKPKDLVGIPWRVAFALQADGWWLRSEIVWSKPNPMPESVTDRPTKAHEQLFLLTRGQWKARVVQPAHVDGEGLHLGSDFWPTSAPVRLADADFCVRLASAILDSPEVQEKLRLPSLDAEVGKEGAAHDDRRAIGALPIEHRAAVLAARLLRSQASSKEFLHELHGLGIALADSHDLLIGGLETQIALPPGVTRYGEGTVAVHYPGEVRELDLRHGTIVTSRPSTCSYYYDADAVREPTDWSAKMPDGWATHEGGHGSFHRDGREAGANNGASGSGRNLRSVWNIATEPYPGAHFATFPRKLVEPCVKAGTSERGVCPECGAPWTREVESGRVLSTGGSSHGQRVAHLAETARLETRTDNSYNTGDFIAREHLTTGWRPSCAHDAEPVAGVVLDPFAGSGTTGMVAQALGRRAVLIDLNGEYLVQAMARNAQTPLGLVG